jgi:hypothetical protein
MRGLLVGAATVLAVCLFAAPSPAQDAPSALGVLELHFTPVRYAQLAIWVENGTGDLLATVRLTEAVAYRGIGNRPGASEMNSGFRWPYGRREGALPVWGTRRAAAPGAKQFNRVIFQNRTTEGLASRTSNDYSPDTYYCLSFDRTRSTKDALDAVSCASAFNSDKGRFLTEADVAAGYAEPYEHPGTRKAEMRPLSLTSLYPPRRDITPCTGMGCYQHADTASFADHAREVMPDIDSVTMATPVGGVPQRLLYTIPRAWEPGDYRACIEINVEGDYNDTFNDHTLPTPMGPTTPINGWDSWATGYGYPYRGQPSVVYCTPFTIGSQTAQSFSTDAPVGSAGTWEVAGQSYGQMQPMTGMTDDPVHAPGSGADRLQLMEDGYRLKVVVKPSLSCMQDAPPSAITGLTVQSSADKLHAHEWARLSFQAASDDNGIFRYDVRVSTEPITDDASFLAAMPAKQATIEAAELLVPVDAKPGAMVETDFGGLVQRTHYYVAVRALDGCNAAGPISSAQLTTPQRQFATVTPCFVATAAWGSPLAKDVGVLRRLRDRQLQSNGVGRALVSAYYRVGPVLADVIRQRETLRAAARAALRPVVALARWLDR